MWMWRKDPKTSDWWTQTESVSARCSETIGGTCCLVYFLPPTNEVWGKVMFLHLCVTLSPSPRRQTWGRLGRPPSPMQTHCRQTWGWVGRPTPDADPHPWMQPPRQTPSPGCRSPVGRLGGGWADPLDADRPVGRPGGGWADSPGKPPLDAAPSPDADPPSWMQAKVVYSISEHLRNGYSGMWFWFE